VMMINAVYVQNLMLEVNVDVSEQKIPSHSSVLNSNFKIVCIVQ